MKYVSFVTIAIALAGCNSGSRDVSVPSNDVVLARQSASGRHAQAVSLTDTGRSRRVSVRVNAVPNQRAMGYWTVVCRLAGSFGRDADDFRGARR
jgi:hypothetical protein